VLNDISLTYRKKKTVNQPLCIVIIFTKAKYCQPSQWLIRNFCNILVPARYGVARKRRLPAIGKFSPAAATFGAISSSTDFPFH
jgi:hypothetical protein